MSENVFLIVFPALMIFAALSDLLTFTIPNRVPLILVLGYIIAAVYFQFTFERITQDLFCGVAVLLIGAALFGLNMIGGGDAKLAASTALWIGWENLFSYGVLASLFGAALTILIVSIRFYDVPRWLLSIGFVARLADKNNGVPYGVALAFGGLSVYPRTQIWSYMAGVA